MTELTPTQEKMIDLAQGNPGALTVLMMLQVIPEFIDYMYEFTPRGPAIWVLYKDWCDEDIVTFMQVLLAMMANKQPEVVEALRAEAMTYAFSDAWESANGTS